MQPPQSTRPRLAEVRNLGNRMRCESGFYSLTYPSAAPNNDTYNVNNSKSVPYSAMTLLLKKSQKMPKKLTKNDWKGRITSRILRICPMANSTWNL